MEQKHLIKEKLKRESNMVKEDSMDVLKEFENMDDVDEMNWYLYIEFRLMYP